jgi:hypothetical protein
LAAALLARRGSEALLAVYRYDLPAAQAFSGNSDLLIAPAWRLPRELRDWIEAGAWLRERPVAIPVETIAGGASESLEWVPLTDCVRSRAALVDGHLRVPVLRTATRWRGSATRDEPRLRFPCGHAPSPGWRSPA